ncbi:MAG: hypothetical protein QME35_06495 [Thermoanaerobacteraceae bacterium]|nr:hypothetical protein [Thermoanaerobacteraceae bacterium]
MKKSLIFLLLTLILIITITGIIFIKNQNTASTEAPTIEWEKAFGKGEGNSVIQTKDGGYVLTGWSASYKDGSDVFLSKFDKYGNQLWFKTYTGNGYSSGHCVIEVNNGNFLIVGETKSKYGYDHDVYVVKTDKNGNRIWEKTYGGSHCDYGWSVIQTKDGFAVAGGTESFGAGIYDVYLIKIDSSGKEIWQKTYGGKESDCGYALQQDNDGGFIIVGNSASFGTGTKNPKVYLIKTDSNGKLIWQKTYGGKGCDYGWSLIKNYDNGYLIAGEKEITTNQGGGFASYLIKTDHNGNKLWEKTYGDSTSNSAYAVCRAKNGGYIFTGKKETNKNGYDINIVKTDKNGNRIWEKAIEGRGFNCGYGIFQANDGGYVIAGRKGTDKNSESSILLIKLKPQYSSIF